MASSLTLYTLKTCDTCRKARRVLEAAGFDVKAIDLREDADLADRVPIWLRAEPEALINKSSATWRALSTGDKARAATNPAALLKAHPTLIKRPVIEQGEKILVGFGRDVQAALGVLQTVT